MTFWKELDNTLTSTRFPNLAILVVKWDYEVPRIDDFRRLLNEMLETDRFKKALPKLYKSGILWCGLSGSDIVYHVAEPAFGSDSRTLLSRRHLTI